ncbi:hypothetical protein CEUSTIGMA_g809.t1 [Chlamydomonas eustigma]|uniref:PAS domain-containing protein n=1 Tax=Chlamydomonas eustigma TaxID=1157962 RepID=A0A250WRM8_9CHLO|nr:hypothetical protein CEUSTIGMA_g809.t1 [Chlamydomonas eustigma]|eukprot:GAX73356.1 hypothetical protein CEUSTIGMA_g809.t1 [Chlamydomonas eustigma]
MTSVAGSEMSSVQENPVISKLEHDDDDDEHLLESEDVGLMKGFFGVIYTVSRERTVTWKFVAFKLILDLWQLLTLTINTQYGWTIDPGTVWWQVLDIIQLNYFMSARGLTFFLVCLYIFIALLVFTLAICIWVAWSFKNQQFDYVWPITFLRFFGVVFFQMLDIVSMTFFLMTLDCRYFGVPSEYIGYNQEFPAQYCWSFPYFINAAFAALAMVIFVVLSTAFQMGEMELNMMTTNMLGMAHSKAEVQAFLIKFLMTSASVFLNSLEWLSIFYLLGATGLLYIGLVWEPFYHSWVNHIRSGVNGALFYSALLLVFLIYCPGIDTTNTNDLYNFQYHCTIALIAGLAPAAILFMGLSVLRMKRIDVIVDKFRKAPPGKKSKSIHKFSDVREVEMCARCCRKWLDEDVFDPEAIELAHVILKAGMEQLPGDAFMIILYASFLMDVKGGSQSGLAELNAARKADKSILEKFALFSREQLHTQKSSGAKGSQGADLVSYVEQQRSYRMSMKVNKEAFEASSAFWALLTKSHVRLSQLAKKVSILDRYVEDASLTYRKLLQRSPDNWQLLRMYAVFQEMIKNDPWGAAKNYAEADRLMQAEEDAKRSAFLTETAMAAGKGKAARDNSKAVIIMNAKCMMQSVNKAVCDITGYTQKELLGKNVNMLIPRPFSDQHDNYVARYLLTGRPTILNQFNEFVILHKDRYVIGIQLRVTKISGFGMDTVFMGVFKTIPSPPNSARAWVLSGGIILSVDSTFSDWFGYNPQDLPGAYFTNLVRESRELEAVFDAVMTESKGGAYQNSSQISNENSALQANQTDHEDLEMLNKRSVAVHDMPETYIKHKYANPVKCSINVSGGGGGGAHNFFILTISREDQGPTIVTDSKGKLLHISKVIAEDLGYTVLDLLLPETAENIWDIIMPEPFNHLHRTHIQHELQSHTPPYSCRTGLTVCLMAASDEGPKPKPYKLRVKTKRSDKQAFESTHIVDLTASSMEQALDERRLSIVTDQMGLVIRVGGSPASLFGFDPKAMIGNHVSNYIDVFQCDETVMEKDASKYAQDLLIDLAIRSLEAPGETFRVGVTAPLRADVGRAGALSSAVAWHMHEKGTHPAVMAVKVNFSEEPAPLTSEDKTPNNASIVLKSGDIYPVSEKGEDENLDRKLLTKQYSKQITTRRRINRRKSTVVFDSSVTSDRRKMSLLSQASTLSTVAEGKALRQASFAMPPKSPEQKARLESPDEMHLRVMTPPVNLWETEDKELDIDDLGPAGLEVEISLWRSDLVAGILHLDRSGCVTQISELPMHQPGLVLGRSDESLHGLHIGSLIPAMESKPVNNLFLKDFGVGPKAAVKRGGLKTGFREAEDAAVSTGPTNMSLIKHWSDDKPLGISVQAIRLRNSKREICVLLHVHKPQSGPSNLLQILRENPIVEPAGLEEDFLLKKGSPDSPTDNISPNGYDRPSIQRKQPHSSSLPLVAPRSVAIAFPESGGDSLQMPRKAVTLAKASTSSLEDTAQRSLSSLTAAALAPLMADPLSPKVSRGVNIGQAPTLDELVTELREYSEQGDTQESPSRMSSNESLTTALQSIKKGNMRTASWVESGGKTGYLPTTLPPLESIPQGKDEDEDEYPLPRRVTRPSSPPVGKVGQGIEPIRQLLSSKLPDLDAEQGGNGGGSVQGSEDQHGTGTDLQDTDYRRGKRFKKVSRLLMSEAAQRGVKIYKYLSYAAMVYVTVISVICFVVMYLLLVSQTSSVQALNVIGTVGVKMGDVYVRVVALGGLFDGQFAEGLQNFQDPTTDIPTTLARLTSAAAEVQNELFTAYYDVLGLPDIDGLREVWDSPTINISVFTDIPGGVTDLSYANYSFWDAGNLYVSAAQTIIQDAFLQNQSLTTKNTWQSWSVVQFIRNNVQTLYDNVITSLDDVVLDAVNSAFSVNLVQLIFLAVEGIAGSFIITFFVYSINMRAESIHYTLFSPFMVVPLTVIRNMVKIDLDSIVNENKSKDEDSNSPMKLSLGRAAAAQLMENANWWDKVFRFFKNLSFWSNKVSPEVGMYNTKRHLHKSSVKSIIMSLPFFAWGIVIIAINAAGHAQLGTIANPIAIFNLVNSAHMRYLSGFALQMEMTLAPSLQLKERRREHLIAHNSFPKEYSAMLYGHSAVPNSTSPHYTLAAQGVTTTGTQGAYILFQDHSCLRSSQVSCLPSNSSIYQDTVNGLNRAVMAHEAAMNSTFLMSGPNPELNSTAIYTIWNLRSDIESGLNLLNAIYYQYVLAVYNDVIIIQIIGLVISLTLMVIFYVCLLRPYLSEISKCRKRVAYLLSTLPIDVDVETLVKRAVTMESGAAADSGAERSMGSMSSSIGDSSNSMMD